MYANDLHLSAVRIAVDDHRLLQLVFHDESGEMKERNSGV